MPLFLRCLGIEFGLAEVTPGAHEPIDVAFRSARFQIRAMLDSGRKPDREWKTELTVRRQAIRLEETIRPYNPPRTVTDSELLVEVCDALKSKQKKYEQMYPNGREDIDALLYVDWNAHLDVTSAPLPLDELEQQNWRSISLLFVPYAEVVLASGNAPEFLRERQDAI